MNLAAGFLGLDWQAWASIVISVVSSIGISVAVYYRQKTPRTLDYAIRSTQDLTGSASPHVRTRLEVIWRDLQVGNDLYETLKEPRIVNYHIRNTGKRGIDADDFKKPIEISVATGSIVDVVVTSVSQPGILELGSIPGESSTRRVFTPVLLNKNDWINIQVITDGCPDPPKLTSWIREESRPMQRRQDILDPPVREVLKRQWRQTKGPRWYDVIIVILVLLFLLSTVVARW